MTESNKSNKSGVFVLAHCVDCSIITTVGITEEGQKELDIIFTEAKLQKMEESEIPCPCPDCGKNLCVTLQYLGFNHDRNQNRRRQ